MAPNIDHTAFPAIVDLIIHHADIKTQLVFRRTSKQLCALIDKQLFKHALLTDVGGPGYSVDFPSLPGFPQAVQDYSVPYRAIEVVDVKLGVEPPSRIYQLEAATSVHTIRRVGWMSTLAHFVCPDNLSTVVDFVDAADYTPAPRIIVSSTQERHILHLRWDDHKYNDDCTPSPSVSFNLNGPSINLKEFVIALWPGDVQDGMCPNALLCIILDLDSYLRFWGKLRIVGLERTAIGGEGHDIKAKVKMLRETLLAGFAKIPGVKDNAEELDRAITFLTFDEWCKELGHRKDTEGVWNPLVEIEVDDAGHEGDDNSPGPVPTSEYDYEVDIEGYPDHSYDSDYEYDPTTGGYELRGGLWY